MLAITEDRYQGITIETSDISLSEAAFRSELEQLMLSLHNKKLLWVKVNIEQSAFIPVLTNLGFEFHHCDERSVMLVKRLTENAYIPTSRNYIAGVGAVVLRNNKLLVIKDKFQPGYKLPGGHIDKGETLKAALQREVLEETGVEVVLESIMNIGHFNAGQFGESNLYFVCTARALSHEIFINDADEILEARWMDVDVFLNHEEVNNYNKKVVEAAISNTGLKLTEQEVELRIPGEVFL
ncbi:NUDIX domain-containing protein [Carboxylicivirga sp. A043]|uniref:NUDIX domain-containing protein n=1 Tax=Carboxylicivirga litoralis TaxID=2816963 RepID=UPI0021CB284A|nr:NUDIX domain-containing protein [Carboxylicivirga sp. A043]MCU4155389.1 NUDIX domain-containing protein [Carboxylicivirga sp. A043]